MNIINSDELSLKDYVECFQSDHISKKKRGVVFTNNKLINKLLDTLPKEVWINKCLKWLDPGSGIGNIMIHIFFRLMKTIPIKDTEKRRKHILENMLYFVEIKSHYIGIIKDIFCFNKYNLNIHDGSYVLMNTENDNNNLYEGEIMFDIIVTNPPYQKPSKDGGISAKPLYHLFIQKSLEVLKEGGYLVAIHPFTWRRKSREIKLIDHLLKYQIHYLYTNNNFKEFDKSAIHINYYILEKVPTYKRTICDNYFNDKYYRSEIQFKNSYEYLPILLTEETLNIIEKMKYINNDKFTIKLESKLSSTHSKDNTSSVRDNIYKYKNFHTYSLKKGENIYKYTKEKHPSHDKLKIIMNFKGGYNIFKPFIDYGSMGITDHALYMEVKNKAQGLKILKILQSKLFIFILMITSYNYAPNKKIEFHILNTLSISEDYLLIQKEIDLINKIVR